MCIKSPIKIPSSNDISGQGLPLIDAIILAKYLVISMIAVNKWLLRWHLCIMRHNDGCAGTAERLPGKWWWLANNVNEPCSWIYVWTGFTIRDQPDGTKPSRYKYKWSTNRNQLLPAGMRGKVWKHTREDYDYGANTHTPTLTQIHTFPYTTSSGPGLVVPASLWFSFWTSVYWRLD